MATADLHCLIGKLVDRGWTALIYNHEAEPAHTSRTTSNHCSHGDDYWRWHSWIGFEAKGAWLAARLCNSSSKTGQISGPPQAHKQKTLTLRVSIPFQVFAVVLLEAAEYLLQQRSFSDDQLHSAAASVHDQPTTQQTSFLPSFLPACLPALTPALTPLHSRGNLAPPIL
eukprot:gene6469-9345_t